MKKHKPYRIHGIIQVGEADHFVYARCERIVHRNRIVKTWRGIPVAKRCKNCLRAERGAKGGKG